MSKEITKKSDRRHRHHHPKKKSVVAAPSPLTAATSSKTGLPEISPESASGLVSPISRELQPSVDPTPASPLSVITGQPATSSGSATSKEPASPGGGSGGHPDQGSHVPVAATSTLSGATTVVQTPKLNGDGEHRTQQLQSEGGTTQAQTAAMQKDVTSALSSAVIAAPSSVAHTESTSDKDRDQGPGRALTGHPYAAPTDQLEPSKGTALLGTTTKTVGRTTSAHEPTAGVAGRVPQPRGDVMPQSKLPPTKATAAQNYRGAIVLASCGVLVLIAILVIFLSRSHRHVEGQPLPCSTEDCRRHVKLLTKNLNLTLNPCEDFHAFVCSAAPSTSDRSENFKTVVDGLRLSWYNQLRDMLIGGSLKLPVGRKALAMYTWCRDQYPSDAPDLPLFLDFLRGQGMNWPEPPRLLEPPLQFAIRLVYLWHAPFWMTVSVLEVPAHTSSTDPRRRVQIRPSSMVPVWLHHHWTASPVYTTYWEHFLLHMYPDNSTRPTVNETVVKEVYEMEERILKKLNSLFDSASPKPKVFSFGELSTHVPNASAPEWLRSFQKAIPLRRQLSFDDEIAVSDDRLLRTVSELLRKYDERQLNMHLTWLFVQYYAPVADYQMLVDHYGSKHNAAAFLPVFCGHHVEDTYKVLVVALDLVYRFTARDIKTVNDGFADMVSAAVEKVNASDWMDDLSKARLTEKIFSVKKTLWPPDAVVNADVLEKLYTTYPENTTSFAAYWMASKRATGVVDVTGQYEEAMRLPWNTLPAYVVYDYVSNTMELATATIAEPLYYSNGAKAMLYGGLLFLMATHVVRAFDREGVRWTPNGTEVDSILSNASLFEYHDRERCLDGDIEHSVFPEVPAVDIAYTAMKQSHVRDGSEPLALRDDLSEDKAFFMTLCYISCEITGKESSRNFDCNKVARNSRAFAKAFHCPTGSKMNPDKKCNLFVT
ncbi:endothelin-converting enzyme 2-like [Dermacentor silvarum]|uniref:endothelin-converting enzyme 2-like n=1 Tax=Dermacentor silvarum TaxID=543639 RepID=UPI001898DF5E|nr:endothelin-converting enzyme 2-like [Dermacentor silvarum]